MGFTSFVFGKDDNAGGSHQLKGNFQVKCKIREKVLVLQCCKSHWHLWEPGIPGVHPSHCKKW